MVHFPSLLEALERIHSAAHVTGAQIVMTMHIQTHDLRDTHNYKLEQNKQGHHRRTWMAGSC